MTRRRSNNGGAGGCARSSDKMVVSFSPPLSSFSLPVTGKEKEEKMGESEAGTVPCLTRYGEGANRRDAIIRTTRQDMFFKAI